MKAGLSRLIVGDDTMTLNGSTYNYGMCRGNYVDGDVLEPMSPPVLPLFCSPHAIISLLTQQSRTFGSSYISICRFPRRSKCSIAEMSRDPTAVACVLKE